jgi:filamentous hemagglutinin family protein
MQQIYWLQRLGITISSVTVFWSNYSLAQITPDTTLSNNSNVTRDGNVSIIEGGTQAGSNLFHSFQEFSVPTGDTAFFNNATNVQNIISRVTGGSVSNIDGLIRANSTANLFLINPNGVIFGQNARLDIGGSFVGSTANSLKFADGFDFSATAPQTTPLLTINVPIGLQFGENPGNIRVQGIGGRASSEEGLGLRVLSGKTLALVGGNVTIEGAFLNAPGGRIELGSVTGINQVNLNQTNQGWTLNYQNASNFRNIQIFRSFVNITPEEDSNIQSQQESSAISFRGSQLNLETSVIRANTFTSAPGGNVSINVQRLIMKGGASIVTQVFDTGSGGDLTINALDSVELIGTPVEFPIDTILSTQTSGAGKAGSVTINTPVLVLKNGATISATTFGVGKAGNLIINTRELLVEDRAGVFVRSQGTGNAGNLTLDASIVRLDNGTLTADTRSVNTDPNQPQAAINLRVKDLILLRRHSNITANATGENVIGGDVNIDTKFLAAAENSDITATSDDFRGGRVRIKAIGIFGTQSRNERTSESDITARGKTPELSGTIELNTPDVDPSRGLVELPVNLVDASQQIAQGCTPRRGQSNSFVVTGRTGMPLSPSEPLRQRAVITQWVTLDEGIDTQLKPTRLPEKQKPIVEAQGWVVDKRGDVHLVAQVPNELRIQNSLSPTKRKECQREL